jgi:myo-inositol 2-dehydrogenase/D-chiro-inositol 1-dehydrogenase
VPGLQLGYEHSFIHQVAEFIAGLESGKPAKPDFKDGLATDYVVDAVLSSAKTRKWTKVKQVKA